MHEEPYRGSPSLPTQSGSGNDLTAIERRVQAIARVLYLIDGADFDLIVRERADGPTATLVARKIAEALPDDSRGAVKALQAFALDKWGTTNPILVPDDERELQQAYYVGAGIYPERGQ